MNTNPIIAMANSSVTNLLTPTVITVAESRSSGGGVSVVTNQNSNSNASSSSPMPPLMIPTSSSSSSRLPPGASGPVKRVKRDNGQQKE
jgi:hypothetical protein